MSLTGQPVRQKLPKPLRNKAQMGKRVCDSKTAPLCLQCHTFLHGMNESQFWGDWDIDPLAIAARLWAVSGDEEAGKTIVLGSRTAGGVA